jgi:hypothetical protein
MQPITPTDLAHVTGGAAVTACTPSNPSGAQPQQYMSALRNADGSQVSTNEQYRKATMSTADRVNEAYERATAPWEMINGLFGGAGIDRPEPPRVTGGR